MRKANLSLIDLSGKDLSESNLFGSDIRQANLRATNLKNTDLRNADLTGANLTLAELDNANLRGANLSKTNLRGINLTRLDLYKTILRETNLSYANLTGSDLRGADLGKAVIDNTNLSKTDLREMDFVGLRLTDVNFRESNLGRSKLNNSDLSRSDLRGSNLTDSTLDGAILTGAKFKGAQTDGWSIKGVVCEYAFWDREGEVQRDYSPGEFEHLHKEGLRIELFYEDGIQRVEILTLPMLLQYLEQQYEGCVLRLKSIEDAPGAAKATIVIDETGSQDPLKFKEKLQKEAEALRHKLALVEHELDAVYTKVFPAILKQAIAGKKQIKIGDYARVGTLGNTSDSAQVNIDQSNTYTQNDLASIDDLVSDIHGQRAKLKQTFAKEQFVELEASIKTIQAQVDSQNPNHSIVKEALQSMLNTLDDAALYPISSEWLLNLKGLV